MLDEARPLSTHRFHLILPLFLSLACMDACLLRP
uniref:Uncharacterized protein n=1 Tax=Arundo donax TaxID=35708 RepID=A0A0A9FAY4_ARUDO